MAISGIRLSHTHLTLAASVTQRYCLMLLKAPELVPYRMVS